MKGAVPVGDMPESVGCSHEAARRMGKPGGKQDPIGAVGAAEVYKRLDFGGKFFVVTYFTAQLPLFGTIRPPCPRPCPARSWDVQKCGRCAWGARASARPLAWQNAHMWFIDMMNQLGRMDACAGMAGRARRARPWVRSLGMNAQGRQAKCAHNALRIERRESVRACGLGRA